jgi:hypothetical protein
MSIKKKFVTAITTAGLLAGLFGSALVPSALAASSTPDLDNTYAYLETYDTGIDNETLSSAHADDAGDFEGTVKYSLDNVSWWAPYGMVTKNSRYDSYDSEDFSIGFEIRNSSDALIDTVDLVATATGGAFEFSWPYEANSEDIDQCKNPNNVWTSTSQSVENVTQDGTNDANDSYADAEGLYFLCVRSKNAFDGDSGVLTVKANGTTIATIDVTVFGDIASIALSTKNGITTIAEDNNAIGDFWNVLFKDNAGQTLNVNGDENWTYVPDLYNYETSEYLDGGDCRTGDSECLEPTGTARVYNSADAIIDWFGDYAFYYHESRAELEANVCDAGDIGESYVAKAEFTNLDGERIRSNGVTIKCSDDIDKFEVTDMKMEYTSSNTLSGEADWAGSDQGGDDTPSCDYSGYGSEGDYGDAVLAGDIYSGIEIHAVVKDTDGNTMGIDASSGLGFVVTMDGNPDLNLDAGVSGFIANGVVRIGCYVPDMARSAKFALEVTVADPDSSTALEDDLVETFFYVASIELDYTLTRVRNGAKTSATWTADWGLSCSNAVVYFDWINKAGTKGTLANGTSPIARTANLDGVATFTLKRRNMTVYVTAYACDDFEDEDLDELGPVKARYR